MSKDFYFEIDKLTEQIGALKKAHGEPHLPTMSSIAESDLQDLKNCTKDLLKQLKAKANIVDVCALTDAKADASETQKVLQLLQQLFERSQTRFESFCRQQTQINESICPLNCMAKFTWHGATTQPQRNLFRSPLDSTLVAND